MNNTFGLDKNDLKIIHSIVSKYPNKVGIYGSRARLNHKENSDIDFVVYGELKRMDFYGLKNAFEESNLIYKVDVVVYEDITNEEFKKQIDKDVVVLKI